MATIDKAMIYKKDLSAYEKKWFDSLRAEYPNEDLALIAEAAKEQGRIHKIQEENAKRDKEIYEKEENSELCYFRYCNEHKDIKPDISFIIISAFYTCDDPQALMSMTPNEIVRKYA